MSSDQVEPVAAVEAAPNPEDGPDKPLLTLPAKIEEEAQQNASPTTKTPSIKRNKSVGIIEKPKNVRKKAEKGKLVPPDGGWGWLVLFGSTLVNVLVPGTVKSFGVLFVEFLEAFDASPAAGMWIPALCYFLYSSLGPLSSILSVKYSYRTVTLIGGTFAATGMIISCFANSVSFLYVSYGLFVGIGAGLSFPPTVYIVTSYFVRLRGVANGLCISGSALGSIILPPILRIMLEEYGYRGAVLLMGGVTLNVWVAALFYDPVEKHMKLVPEEPESPKLQDAEPFQPKFLLSAEDSMVSLQQIPHNDSFPEIDASSTHFNRSVSSAAMANLINQNKRERKISMPTSKTEVMRVKAPNGGCSSSMNVNSMGGLHVVPEKQNGSGMDVYSQGRLAAKRPRSGLPKRSPSSSSFQYVSTPYHGSTLTLQPETFASTFSLRSVKSGKNDDKADESPKKKFFDLTLLRDPIYLIILISNATNAISYTNFIILLPSYAKNLNFDKNTGAMLLSIVSALDLVGRIGGSALSDLSLCPKYFYFIGGLTVSGLSLGFMPFSEELWYISLFCAIFGLASGVYVGVTAVIMADMLGEERLQSTYGISLFVNGILQLIGPPICGYIFEAMGSFTALFCSLGIILVVGSVIWGFIPFVKTKNQEENV